MPKKKTPGIPGMGNTEMHAAMVGKRSSGAAGTHADKRDKRARTRAAKLARDLKRDAD